MGGVTYHTRKRDPEFLAYIALASKLYVRGDGWTLRGDLEQFRPKRDFIALAKADGVPVGVCVALREGWISVYVREKFRRKGIGSELIKRTKALYSQAGNDPGELSAGDGVRGSRAFWAANEISVEF